MENIENEDIKKVEDGEFIQNPFQDEQADENVEVIEDEELTQDKSTEDNSEITEEDLNEELVNETVEDDPVEEDDSVEDEDYDDSDEELSEDEDYDDSDEELSEDEEIAEDVDSNEQNVLNSEINYVPKSHFQVLIDSFIEKLSFIGGLLYTGAVTFISLLGFLFFGSLQKSFGENVSMANSCLILKLFFIIVFCIFVVLFITSIVFNIQRRKHDKN